VRRHQRQQAKAKAEQKRSGRQQVPALPHVVHDETGGRLHQKNTEAAHANGNPDGIVAPSVAAQEFRQERQNDAGHLGQEEVGEIQGPPALRGWAVRPVHRLDLVSVPILDNRHESALLCRQHEG
jgi:hypothetical protein